jgi:outer membrane protein OmpA-like peptidoglycan-associated protein
MRISLITTGMAGSALMVACASHPPLDSQQIERARTEVQTFAQNPAAQEIASHDLAAARESLSHAEDALKEKKQAEVDHYSYLAVRQSQTGEARIAERDARQRVANTEAERTNVLLQARNAELESQKRLASAQPTGRGQVLTLSGVMFDTGKATLKPGAGQTLDQVSSFMAQNPKTRLIIQGHTDNQGSGTTNLQLSELRAEAVADALTMRGVPRDRIEALGVGEASPVASNSTPEGRQQNRRVELLLSDQSGRFAEGARGVNR